MNFLSTSENNQIAFCGKQFVHIYSTNFKAGTRASASVRSAYSVPQNLSSLDLSHYMPDSCKVPHDKISTMCCQLSKDGNFLCVADSEKNVFIFDKLEAVWELFVTFETDKKILKVQFDLGRKHLVMTDKCGDVYISSLSSSQEAKQCIKILGHCSLILDTALSADNNYIFTADRDEKIRCSKFPDAYQIEYFLLGHKQAVANFGLLNDDHNLLSICIDGELKLWTTSDKRCIKTWNVFQICHGLSYVKPDDHEIKRMRVTSVFDSVYFGVVINGTREIPVFELKVADLQIRQLGQVKMDSELCDLAWSDNVLFTYNPELPAVVRRFTVTSEGVLCDTGFSIPKISEFAHDFKDFASFNQTFTSLRKRVSGESVRAEDLKTRMEDYMKETDKKVPRIVREANSSSHARADQTPERALSGTSKGQTRPKSPPKDPKETN